MVNSSDISNLPFLEYEEQIRNTKLSHILLILPKPIRPKLIVFYNS